MGGETGQLKGEGGRGKARMSYAHMFSLYSGRSYGRVEVLSSIFSLK